MPLTTVLITICGGGGGGNINQCNGPKISSKILGLLESCYGNDLQQICSDFHSVFHHWTASKYQINSKYKIKQDFGVSSKVPQFIKFQTNVHHATDKTQQKSARF